MPIDIDGRRYLKTAEAAKKVDVNIETIRRWLDKGYIVGEKSQTGRWLVEEESLTRHFRRHAR